MTRYFVFAYKMYYPKGGIRDCVLKTDDIQHVEREVECLQENTDHIERPDFIHVYDGLKDETIYEWKSSTL